MDYSITRRNALHLAVTIERKWHTAGFPWVRAWVEKDDNFEALFVVRSNIRWIWDGASYQVSPWAHGA